MKGFEFDGTPTGEYRSGLYVTYCGKEYLADYLGVGRFVLYSDYADSDFSFPNRGKYILQTDLRDDKITCACEVHTCGIVKECFEHIKIHDIFEEGVVVSTKKPRLAFQLGLKPVDKYGFAGLIDRNVLAGIYEERDYLWNPGFSIYSTFCQAIGSTGENSWFVDKDRLTQFYIVPTKK